MRSIITICCFLLFPLLSYSQFNTSIDFILGGEGRQIENRFIQFNEVIVNYKFGVNFNFRVSDRIIMKTGLRYSRIGTVEEEFMLNRLSSSADILPCQCSLLSRDKRYFEIPLIARFEFGKSKFSYFMEMGLSPHFYVNTNLSIRENPSNITSDAMMAREIEYGQKRMLMSYVISLGMNFNFSQNYQIFFQPIFQMNSSEVYEIGNIEGNHVIGIEFGLRYALSSTP